LSASSNIPLLLMTLPGIIWFLCFSYIPMTGVVMAFKNFKPKYGMYMSPWVGMKNFNFMFKNATFWLTVKNTLMYNSIFLVTGVICPLTLALAIPIAIYMTKKVNRAEAEKLPDKKQEKR